jgi:hypothetical protein
MSKEGPMPSLKINVTKNYQLFTRGTDNRPTNEKKHKRLFASMKKYGFLSSFPIICYRNGAGHLIVKDGQHRLMFAETLGLPVYWKEETVDFDLATVNSTPVNWALVDYAKSYAERGIAVYKNGLEFCQTHRLPIGMGFAMLAGNVSYSNISADFTSGNFKIKDRPWADAVASVYVSLVALSAEVQNARCLEACMAICRVKDLDIARLLINAKRCREKLVAYSTREAYLDLLEEVYNFGRKFLLGLKSSALMAMKERFFKKDGNGKEKTTCV